jgi:hypothetical protein
MKRNLFLRAMPAMALICTIAVIGCNNGTKEEPDTWSNITSLNQIDGTWKGTYSQNNRPVKDVMEEFGMPWDSDMQILFGDMKVTARVDITMTIDAGDSTIKMDMASTGTFSGGNINELWPMLKLALVGYEEEDITINDTNHSITMTYSIPAMEITDEDIAEIGLQMNQNGTKIKSPANFVIYGTPELIFIKQ